MSDQTVKLTKKGQATRDRIVAAAASLMREHGVLGTTNEDIRRQAEVSGSQLSHYFPDKHSLVSAVLQWRAESVKELTTLAAEGRLDSFAGLRGWIDSYLSHERVCIAGCSFGSLAGEVMAELGLRDDIAAGFDSWEELFRAGLTAMRDRGDLNDSADPDALANMLMASFQGGMLLSQAAGDPRPLRDALNGAYDYLSTFRAQG